MTRNSMTPGEALGRLSGGNDRFRLNRLTHQGIDPERSGELLVGQQPYAAILTCSDSRVPPEHIFDAGLGDLFVIRNAGNILDHAATASVMYAVEHLDCPLVVVMGHEQCGALTAALSDDSHVIREAPPIIKLIEIIRANIPQALSLRPGDGDRLDSAIRENMDAVAGQLAEYPRVAEKIDAGSLAVKKAYYSLADRTVEWL